MNARRVVNGRRFVSGFLSQASRAVDRKADHLRTPAVHRRPAYSMIFYSIATLKAAPRPCRGHDTSHSDM